MPRRPRFATGGIAYHVLNRRVGRLPLFEKLGDYSAFEKVLSEVCERTNVRIAAYCLMPNHWHLLLWPRADGELSEVMRWITVTHTQRWHAHRRSAGSGPVYQGRFKSFPVQTDEHFLTVARYVERNAMRAGLVERAEHWQWSSL
jgi:putative transposase